MTEPIYRPPSRHLLVSFSTLMESSKQELYSTSGRIQRAGSGASTVIDPSEPVDFRNLRSSQYKGVVAQPNGRWGAQIYQSHHRVWLGTFSDEPEAARAYDVAVQRFRGDKAITNFIHLSKSNAAERIFIQSHTKDEIVDMLRKHIYQDELERSRSSYKLTQNTPQSLTQKMVLELLFEKTVTPSDVGKLNRLVIPKQQAEKHLPVPDCGKGLLLSFVDGCSEAVWRIRYSYWNSSQSYVLTKGWSRFVSEKGLKAGDVVCFMRSSRPEKKLYIDWRMSPVRDAMKCPTVGPVTARVVMLFGVNICNLVGKRYREVEELESTYSFKRQQTEAL